MFELNTFCRLTSSDAVTDDFVCLYQSLCALKFTCGNPADCDLKAADNFTFLINGRIELTGYKGGGKNTVSHRQVK